MPTTETIAALNRASRGLTYPSETDAPWAGIGWPAAAGAPSAAGIRALGLHSAATPVAEQTVAEFFAPLTAERDWYGDAEKAIAARYRALAEVVAARLATPKAFRVGETEVTLYVVGVAREGGWAGLKAVAVET